MCIYYKMKRTIFFTFLLLLLVLLTSCSSTNQYYMMKRAPSFEVTNIDIVQESGNSFINMIYGGMYYHNHSGFELDFDSTDIYYNMFMTDAISLNGFNFTGGIGINSSLTAEHDGLYKASYMASGDGVNNHEYYTSLFINENNQMNCETHHKMSAGGDIITVAGSCFINLNVGDKVSVRTVDKTAISTGNYYSANLNLLRIGN